MVQSICKQMKRGAVAIFGPTSWSSVNLLNSFTNYYDIPYLTWSDPAEPITKQLSSQIKTRLYSSSSQSSTTKYTYQDIMTYNILKFQSKRSNRNDYDYDNIGQSYDDEISSSREIKIKRLNQKSSTPFYLKPDISNTLIDLMKYYEWTTVYYVYNYDEAVVKLESLFDYQMKNLNNFTRKIIIRKVKNVNNCLDMLRSVEVSKEISESAKDSAQIIMIIDLNSRKSFMTFLKQIKDLGMTKPRYHYVLATLGIHELDLNEFQHGGVTITGFSTVDYHDVNTVKAIRQIINSNEPLNKIPNIPHEAALIIDGLNLLTRQVNNLIKSDKTWLFGVKDATLKKSEIYIDNQKGFNCSYKYDTAISQNDKKWQIGKIIIDSLSDETVSGNLFIIFQINLLLNTIWNSRNRSLV
jgi:hypothetical protein